MNGRQAVTVTAQTTTARRTAKHRAPAHALGRWMMPGACALFVWLGDGDPFGAAGFLLFVSAGVLLSLFYPLAALMALEAPGALVPSSWRVWWRRGQENRPAISTRLRRIVYAADRHACACCGNSQDLQLDHVRPWSLGGRSSVFNLMTLCGTCNRLKSNYWVFRNGRRVYTPFRGHGNTRAAAGILAFELRHRYNVMRFVRAAVAL